MQILAHIVAEGCHFSFKQYHAAPLCCVILLLKITEAPLKNVILGDPQ